MNKKIMNKKVMKKVNVMWPTSPIFNVLDDLIQINPRIPAITIRLHLQNRIKAGEIEEIGRMPSTQGAPRKVYAYSPLTPDVIDLAKQRGIVLSEKRRVPPTVAVGMPTVGARKLLGSGKLENLAPSLVIGNG